jgi:ribosome maturation protein SDO1
VVSLDDAVTARLESHGTRFEVLVDPERAQEVHSDPDEADPLTSDDLAADKIFKDASKGKAAADENIEEVFDTTDVVEVANRIVRDGDIQLTTEQRRDMKENKRKAIISYIARHALNPQTGNPHPPQRIENAMENVRFHADPFESTEAQVEELLDKLRPIIPIKIEQVNVHVRIPAEHAGAAYGVVRENGKLLREEWKSDGAWEGVVQIPAGMQTDFYEKLNERTKGNVQTKLER